MDVSAFFSRILATEEARLAMDETQAYVHREHPLWVNVVFALEVFGGALGCIGLWLRKTWALPLFIVSLVGVVSQTIFVYFISDAIEVLGTLAIVMPLVAMLIGGTLIFLSRWFKTRLWLN